MVDARLARLLDTIALPAAAVKFNTPPQTSYLVYLETRRRWGSDDANRLTEHALTFELYSYDFIDEEACVRISNALDEAALPFTQNDGIYLDSEQLYLVTFDFSYLSKD